MKPFSVSEAEFDMLIDAKQIALHYREHGVAAAVAKADPMLAHYLGWLERHFSDLEAEKVAEQRPAMAGVA